MSDTGIYKAINAVMGDLHAVGKDSKNQQQGFQYRSVDAVCNALKPILTKHGVFVAPTVEEMQREERQTAKGSTLLYTLLRIRYTFYHSDGSKVEVVVAGEAQDSGDKATNKAMSAAFKYALCQTFCIPTEDPDEAETEAAIYSGARDAWKSVKMPRGQHQGADLLTIANSDPSILEKAAAWYDKRLRDYPNQRDEALLNHLENALEWARAEHPEKFLNLSV